MTVRLETTLNAMCHELAAKIAEVDIASVYVRESDQLVMRGQIVGSPPSAISA